MDQGGPTSDLALCRQAATHDRVAFGDLYERYVDPVLRLLLAQGAQQETAWDLLQETFTRALRALDRGQVPDRFDLWIRRIALNVFADHWRRSYTKREETTDPHVLPDVASDGEDSDLAEEMRALLHALDQSLRDVIVLHIYQDLSVQDVAGVLGVPVGTVKSRLSRAYRRLGKAIANLESHARPGPTAQRDRRELPRGANPKPQRGGSQA